MLEALVLIAAAIVAFIVVANVVVRDGIAHTRFQRRLQVRDAFTKMARSMGGIAVALGMFGQAVNTAARRMEELREAHDRVEEAFRESANRIEKEATGD